jgi:two-component system, chemotaxis family, response regulator Rcp1
MKKQQGTALALLLVEDNPGDVRLIQEALKEEEDIRILAAVPDGAEAMEFLRKEARYASAAQPDLILLDLNLPGKSGMDVLHEIKVDHQLKQIPVIILTSSRSRKDIMEAYGLHANCFVSKPADIDDFFFIVRSIKEFWSSIAALPNCEEQWTSNPSGYF